MKIAVEENHLGGLILYRSLDPCKKDGIRFMEKVAGTGVFNRPFLVECFRAV